MNTPCIYCHSEHVKKNGHHQNGQQNWQCLECRRQYVEHPLRRTISEETKNQVGSLLKERLSLRGICRQTGVSLTWLLYFLKKETEKIPSHLHAEKVAQSESAEIYHLQIDEL